VDLRFAGTLGRLDWDLEAMGQLGSVAAQSIVAWAAGARTGYTLGEGAWKTQLGVQIDAASGDRRAGNARLGTFNPLFPNGYYFTLASYTGYANLVHIKPFLTVTPVPPLTVSIAVGLQWRQTTADAIYLQPNVPIEATAGRGSTWSGAYAQLRSVYAIDSRWSSALEVVHYRVGGTTRRAGGHDSTFLGAELKLGY
jgi:hypothetical protein